MQKCIRSCIRITFAVQMHSSQISIFGKILWAQKLQEMCAINDPLGQTHRPTSRLSLFSIETCFVLRNFEKSGWTKDKKCENSDYYCDCGSASWINTMQLFGNCIYILRSIFHEFSKNKIRVINDTLGQWYSLVIEILGQTHTDGQHV